MQEMRVPSLGQEDPLEKEMATHSSIAWRIPWAEESLLGYSPWGNKESDTPEYVYTHMSFALCFMAKIKKQSSKIFASACMFTYLDVYVMCVFFLPLMVLPKLSCNELYLLGLKTNKH